MEAAHDRCPTCGSTRLQEDAEGSLTCARCHTAIVVDERLCPECGAVNAPEDERCRACGRILDLVGFVIQSRLQTPSGRLEQMHQQAAALKEELEAVSRERLERWWEQEEERRRLLAQAQAERERQERKMLAGAIIVAVVVVIVIAIYVLVGLYRPGIPSTGPAPLPL